jgi:hypothetical protein
MGRPGRVRDLQASRGSYGIHGVYRHSAEALDKAARSALDCGDGVGEVAAFEERDGRKIEAVASVSKQLRIENCRPIVNRSLAPKLQMTDFQYSIPDLQVRGRFASA